MDGTIIKDRLDPAGMGMFSKTGRFTSEQHGIFRKKEEILLNKPKKFRVDDMDSDDVCSFKCRKQTGITSIWKTPTRQQSLNIQKSGWRSMNPRLKRP